MCSYFLLKTSCSDGNFPDFTSSSAEIVNATLHLFDKIVDRRLFVRRIIICASNIKSEAERGKRAPFEQLDLFVDYEAESVREQIREATYNKEKRAQRAIIDIKRRYGKNAILKGISFEDGATTIDRNLQIGGHKA